MKKIILSIIMGSIIISCNNDREPSPSQPVNLKGTFKLSHYEFKSKNYNITGCDINDKIVINSDKTGVYEDSEYNDATQGCYVAENYAGTWNLQSQEGLLILKYKSNGLDQTKSFDLIGISDTEIRLEISSKNIDGNPGNDNAVAVWTKAY
ncbi:lipocalin family protein [Soonwooa sp.]|uniref:lipocalin family protein n=1 Tax=Soonwooa sp. TaxID=1938592 RepID=UPI00289792A7|nr:lipocalin family protein [Soonwooa sp.]